MSFAVGDACIGNFNGEARLIAAPIAKAPRMIEIAP